MRSFLAALRTLVLPFGATSGTRILLDGVNGVIALYDALDARRVWLGQDAGGFGEDDGISFSTGSVEEPASGYGIVQSGTFGAGGAMQALLRLQSPVLGGGLRSRIFLRSNSDDGTVPARVVVEGTSAPELELNVRRMLLRDTSIHGANQPMGAAVLVAGTVVVNNSLIAANTRVFLTCETPGGVVGTPYVAARVAGTSFTITSTSAGDTSTIGYMLVDPT